MLQHKNLEAPEIFKTQFDDDSMVNRSKIASSRGGAVVSKSGISQFTALNMQGRLTSKMQGSDATPNNELLKSAEGSAVVGAQDNDAVTPNDLLRALSKDVNSEGGFEEPRRLPSRQSLRGAGQDPDEEQKLEDHDNLLLDSEGRTANNEFPLRGDTTNNDMTSPAQVNMLRSDSFGDDGASPMINIEVASASNRSKD